MQERFHAERVPRSKQRQLRMPKARSGMLPITPKLHAGISSSKICEREIVTPSSSRRREPSSVADDDSGSFLSENAPLFRLGTPIAALFAVEEAKHA